MERSRRERRGGKTFYVSRTANHFAGFPTLHLFLLAYDIGQINNNDKTNNNKRREKKSNKQTNKEKHRISQQQNANLND